MSIPHSNENRVFPHRLADLGSRHTPHVAACGVELTAMRAHGMVNAGVFIN
jgi:hypothetical protein